MARCRQPIMDCCPDSPALNRRFAGPVMTGDQQNPPLASANRLLQRVIDRRPRAIKVHSVKVEDPVGLDRAGTKLLIPGAVEGALADRNWPGSKCRFGS